MNENNVESVTTNMVFVYVIYLLEEDMFFKCYYF